MCEFKTIQVLTMIHRKSCICWIWMIHSNSRTQRTTHDLCIQSNKVSTLINLKCFWFHSMQIENINVQGEAARMILVDLLHWPNSSATFSSMGQHFLIRSLTSIISNHSTTFPHKQPTQRTSMLSAWQIWIFSILFPDITVVLMMKPHKWQLWKRKLIYDVEISTHKKFNMLYCASVVLCHRLHHHHKGFPTQC